MLSFRFFLRDGSWGYSNSFGWANKFTELAGYALFSPIGVFNQELVPRDSFEEFLVFPQDTGE